MGFVGFLWVVSGSHAGVGAVLHGCYLAFVCVLECLWVL